MSSETFFLLEKPKRPIPSPNELIELFFSYPSFYNIVNKFELHPIKETDGVCSQIKFVDNNNFPWIRFRLRDRFCDGPNWQPTPLTDWHYNHAEDLFPYSAVEQSRYFGNPNFPLSLYFDEVQIPFIINPFEQIPFKNPTEENLKRWINLWWQLFHHEHLPFPGQYSTSSIQGLSQDIFIKTLNLLKSKGYNYLTSIPTWFHVALNNLEKGFKFYNPSDNEKINRLKNFLKQRFPFETIRDEKKLSWIVVLQYWAELAQDNNYSPEKLLLEETCQDNAGIFILRDENDKILTYPLTPNYNLWQIYQIQ